MRRWVQLFNAGDALGLAALYADDATNHQVALEPIHGRQNILAKFQREFAAAKMHCLVENLFEDGEWAMLEWTNPKGLRGCGFFQVRHGLDQYQRGHWDRLSFEEYQRCPTPPAGDN